MADKNTRLRVLRAEQRLSQMEVGLRAGMTQNRYWRIENGYAEATAEERATLAQVFAVDEGSVFPQAVAP